MPLTMFWKDAKDSAPPLPNSYWVQPGRLLAGEYPGSMSHGEAMERVQTLLRAGITSFIDLTEEGELPAYDSLLPELTEQRIRYQRLSVLDHDIPATPAHMTQIVDAIDAELAAGRCVYVHCRAGIGRTGMAIACHLIRGGRANDEALDHLQTLWRQCARSRRWPSVPETEEQVEFVRKWRDAPQGQVAASTRYEGALLGLALGDALGALASNAGFDASTLASSAHGLRTGVYTATTRALAESVLARRGHDASDQMQRYFEWTRSASAESVPAELRRALAAWQWSKKPNAGTHDPKNLDAHSLPRTLAAALSLRADPQRAMELAADASRTTQQAPIVLDLCRVWAAQLTDALDGASRADLTSWKGAAMRVARQRPLKPPVQFLIDGRRQASDPNDALSASQAAIASFSAANSFRDALLHIIATKRAAPAAVALCGALSGAHYGVDAIPADWRRRITEDAPLRSLARHLLG